MQKLTVSTVSTIAVALIAGLVACQSTTPTVTQKPETSPAKETTPSATSLPGKGVKVRPGTGGLYFGKLVAEILDIGLQNLGYETEEIKELNPTLMHLAIGKGDLDFSSIHLDKSHAPFFKKAGGEEKLERVGLVLPKIVEGYQIDKKTAEQYKITNIEQLKDPKIAQLFDSNGNGKANLGGCEAGRACERNINQQLQAYGLVDTVEQDQVTTEVLLADLMARYKAGKPILFYGFSPSLIDVELKVGKDTVWLEVPFTALPEGQQKLTEKDTSVEGKNRGFVVNKVQIVANKQFLEANPAAKRWFELFRISTEDILAEGNFMKKGETRPQQVHQRAEAWVKQHQKEVDSWLAEARKATKQ